MSPEGFRCADAARERADPPLGTAPQTRRWVLIEHPAPWRTSAVAGSELLAVDPVVRHALLRPPALTRVLLVRRPGRGGRRSHARSWSVVDTGGGIVHGTWWAASDLAPAVAVMRSADAVESRHEGDEPLLLVCTHGVHDQCCAIRGRPVAAALHARWPEQTWECSHLGGDRFAANLLLLPDAALYGNLDAESAVGVVADHVAGRLRSDHLRGLAAFPPIGQIAIGAVHDLLGPLPPNALVATSINATSASTWAIEVSRVGRPVATVQVATSARPAALLTCRAEHATSAYGYDVTAVQFSPGP